MMPDIGNLSQPVVHLVLGIGYIGKGPQGQEIMTDVLDCVFYLSLLMRRTNRTGPGGDGELA